MLKMEFLDPLIAEKFKKQKCIQFCWTPCSTYTVVFCNLFVQLRGYKQGKADLVEQFDKYHNMVKRLQHDDEYFAKIKKMTKKSVGKKQEEGQ